MLALGVLVVLCVAGHAGWSSQLWRLGEKGHDPWSKKITAYFVTGIFADLATSVAAFGLGRVLRWAIG
jgi:cytochrome c oxidase assembly factor CtaG